MCSEQNKTTILHLIRILRTFRSTQQAPLIGENSKGYLSSGMSPDRVDIFLVEKIVNTELKFNWYSARQKDLHKVRYFVTLWYYNTFGETCAERKPKGSSLTSTYYKISVSSKFYKLNNDDKLEISKLYVVCVSYHSLPNILKNMQICAKRKAIKQWESSINTSI